MWDVSNNHPTIRDIAIIVQGMNKLLANLNSSKAAEPDNLSSCTMTEMAKERWHRLLLPHFRHHWTQIWLQWLEKCAHGTVFFRDCGMTLQGIVSLTHSVYCKLLELITASLIINHLKCDLHEHMDGA